MNRTPLLILVLVLAAYSSAHQLTASPRPSATQHSIRIALPGFTHSKAADNSRAFEFALADSLTRDPRITLIDQSLAQSALAGIGYDGSINMSKDEARKLAAAIGCDFFIVGKAEAFTRSERANESHELAYAGVMIVDGRTGALTSNKASATEAARQSIMKTLDAHAVGYVDRMMQVRAQASAPRSKDAASPASPTGDIIEDVPAEDSPRSLGFKPPEFVNRVKPDYPTEAEMADITATVEAMVVFGSTGEVGRIEITRWAGFGLDESSERAIRQLKFKPATRDGNPISVRAMIRYNFRRVPGSTNKLEQPSSKPPDKPERDLREIFRPTFRRP